jgi:hypothetical protein
MADLATLLRSGRPLPPLPSEAEDSSYTGADVRRARQRDQFIKQFGIDPLVPDFQDQVRGNFETQAIPQIAFSAAGPMAGPVGRGLSTFLRSGPGKVAAGAGGVAAAASEASPAEQATDPSSLQSLMGQRATVQRQAEEARSRREQERRTGTGPNYSAADAEFKRINDQLTGLDALIRDEQKRSSPEFALEMQQKRDKAALDAQNKRASTPTRELMSDYTPYIPAVTGLAALLGGAALKGRATRNYNVEVGDLSNRWKSALDRAQSARPNSQTRDSATIEAQGLGREHAARVAKGDRGTRDAMGFGAGVGLVGGFAPEEVDFARAITGSPLWEDLQKNIIDRPLSTAGRAAMATGLGAGVSRLGAEGAQMFMSRPQPPGYGAATAALPPPRPPRGPPAGGSGEPPPPLPTPALPPGASPLAPQSVLPAPQATTEPSPYGLSTLLRTPTQGQLPAPPASTTLPRPQEPIVGGSHPDHSWNVAAGRWQDANGRFLPGKPPKRRDWSDYPEE